MWRRPDNPGLAAVCGAASLCFFADAIKVTPRLVQGVNIAFLVQDDGHAAAMPGGNAGRSPSYKRCW
ncbi:hypothetical protein OGY35_23205 [Citrobacter sp. Ct235]|uniref:hypothetical protein n=1 Tax=Citrobacter sp. Ct235 TaxID=2985157 RepID=UPI00257606E8|nr:hypothetical protein [Citrobacter sp. Ct235]MDM2738263.1 hypothetical protein [Citrobacter sp. Ct235]